MNKDLLTELFKKLDECRQSKPNATFLSIGGRGYYENPASDLLQFFLIPNNAHGLNTLFIEALLEVTGISVKNESLQALTVQREVRTNNDKRIDLLLQADGWLMLIENKIWHEQVNPFEDYEVLANQRMQPNDAPHFIILSPSGQSNQTKWHGLSYRNFIDSIQIRLDKCANKLQANKWWHFAQDFIQHLDQELYGKTMTPEEIKFVKDNYEELSNAAQLKLEYQDYLLTYLPSLINEKLQKNEASSKLENWCIRLFHPSWKPAEIAWFNVAEDGYRVKISIYIQDISEELFQQCKKAIEGTCEVAYWTELKGHCHCWSTENSFDHGSDAETMLLKLSDELALLFSK